MTADWDSETLVDGEAVAPAKEAAANNEAIVRAPLRGALDNTTAEWGHLGGSKFSDEWNQLLCCQVLNTMRCGQNPQPGQELDDQRTAVLAFLAGVNPKDALEGAMAAQLFASHAAAMECYRRAMFPNQTFEGRRENLNQANKLSRTYATLVEALNRHRGKGQQKVTVEHVHVHEGGQAIVGNVEGGGMRTKSENQPHAIAHAPGHEMRSTNTQREAVPVAGDGKR